MEPETSTSELVKVIHVMAGRRGSRIIFWGAVVIGLLLLYPTLHERVEWIYEKYSGASLSWGLLLNAMFAVVLSFALLAIVAVVLALFVGVVGRFIGLGLYRKEIREIREDIADIKENMGLNDGNGKAT